MQVEAADEELMELQMEVPAVLVNKFVAQITKEGVCRLSMMEQRLPGVEPWHRGAFAFGLNDLTNLRDILNTLIGRMDDISTDVPPKEQLQ